MRNMSRPYHQILMMLLAMIVIEAERTVIFSSQLCPSSFVARSAPKVTMPKPSIDILTNENRTKYFMCSEDVTENDTNDNVLNRKSFFLKYNLMLSAVQFGVFLAALPAGLASVCCSSHNVLLTGQLIMATATFMVPLVTNIYWIVAVTLEVFVGIGMAIMVPSVFTIMADWDNMNWKTAIVCFCLAGRPLGQLASLTLISLTCEWEFFPGWIISHFIIGFVGLLWCALWLWFGHPMAPCAGCVNEYCTCDKKESSKHSQCFQGLIMLKIWNAAIKEGAVWGIVFAWLATELIWMLIEIYTTVVNQIAYVNEIWTSAALLATCLLTVVNGTVADKIIDVNPESFRYIRKIFDSLGKVFVIILSIVIVRLHFACTDWFLVMSVLALMTAIHSIQFAGCYVNSVDIGVPCTAVTVSMAMFLSALSKLILWNGLLYTVPFNMRLLSYEPPLYVISVILASSIVLYVLFGAPDVNLYLPVNYDGSIEGCCVPCRCCRKRKLQHEHILTIMNQVGNREATTLQRPGCQTSPSTSLHKEQQLTGNPVDETLLLPHRTSPTVSSMQRMYAPDPESCYMDREPDCDEMREDCIFEDYVEGQTMSPSQIPVVIVEDFEEDSDWPPPPPPCSETVEVDRCSMKSGERPLLQLRRCNALDLGDRDRSGAAIQRSPHLLRSKAINMDSQDLDCCMDPPVKDVWHV